MNACGSEATRQSPKVATLKYARWFTTEAPYCPVAKRCAERCVGATIKDIPFRDSIKSGSTQRLRRIAATLLIELYLFRKRFPRIDWAKEMEIWTDLRSQSCTVVAVRNVAFFFFLVRWR